VRSLLIGVDAKNNKEQPEKQCLAGLFFQKLLISRNGPLFHHVLTLYRHK